MKARSLLPRGRRPQATAAFAPRTPSRAWSLEALEPRVLLSADPVFGAIHLALLAPDAGPVDDAYTAAEAPTMRALAAGIGSRDITASNNIVAASYSLTNDSLAISGNVLIQATAGGIVIGGFGQGHKLSGNSSATSDNLSLNATGSITINAAVAVGAAGTDTLSSLNVVAAQNVSFRESVEVAGALVINATGVVTFDSTLTLKNGGSLTILGASQIVMKGAVSLQLNTASTPGNIVLEANEIDLFDVGEEQVTGSGSVTLRAATPSLGMALFSPTGAPTANTLNLDTTDLRAFADGFSGFTFGHQAGGHALNTAGAVLIGASTAPDSLALRDGVQVFGGSITVTDYSAPNAILRLGAGDSLTLDAWGDISLQNEIEADRLQLYSAVGRIAQSDATADTRTGEALRTLNLGVTAATGVSLGSLEVQTLAVVNTGSGDISLAQNAVRATSRFPTEITADVSVSQLTQSAGSAGNDIALLARAGSITLAAGAGNGISNGSPDGGVSLIAQGTGSDLSLLAPIGLRGGPLTLTAADSLTTSAAAPITASGAAAVSITATGGALSLGAAVSTVGGSLALGSGAALNLGGVVLDAGPSGAISLQSSGDLSVGVINAALSISLTSGGTILDGLAGDAANLRGEAASATLRAVGGVGTAAAPLRTSLGAVSASVSGASGGIFIAEATGLSIAAAGLSTAGAGSIVVRTASGDLSSAGAVNAAGSGHVLLEAAGTLSLQAAVTAQSGSISLLAGAALAASAEIRSRGAGQTLDLRAGGALSLGAQAVLATVHGGQRLQGSTLALGSLDAGTGSVSLVASSGSVAATGLLAAGSLRIQAGGAVGSPAEPLQTRVGQFAAAAGGALLVNEADDLSLASLADPAINRVGAAGTLSAIAPGAALAGLTSGGLAVISTAGSLSVDAAATAASHLRLGAAANLAVNAAVGSSGGQLSLLAAGSLTQGAAGSLGTAGGQIDAQAGGAMTLAAGSTVSSNGGRLRLQAGGALTLGQLDAGAGEAWLQAPRIVGASGSGLDLAAADARLIATADGIGSAADALSLRVQRLAVQSAGAAFMAEADGLTAGAIAASSGSRVGADGSVSALAADAALAGLGSTATLVLGTGGDLTLAAATRAQNTRLSAAHDLSLQAALTATGTVSLAAGRDLLVQATTTTSAGLDLTAGRDLLMTAGVLASAQAASALQAGRDLHIAQVSVPASQWLALQAGAALRDADAAGDAAPNLSAGRLSLIAGSGLGTPDNAIETATSFLAASGGSGGLFIDEADALTVGPGPAGSFAAAQRVDATGALAPVTLTEVQGLATRNAPLLLRVLGGSLGLDTAVASGGGAMRLSASGLVSVQAGIASAGGVVSLLAGGAVQQGAAGLIDSGSGVIDAESGAGWSMAQGAQIRSGGGDVRLAVGGALTLATLDAGLTGTVSLTATQVRDLAGDLAGPDLTAARLLLRSTGTAAADGIGSAADAIEIAVTQLAADSGPVGGLFLAQQAAGGMLRVGALAAFSAPRVQLDGSVLAGASSDAALAGLRSGAALVLRAAAALEVNAASSAAGAVLITSGEDLAFNGALSSAAAISLNAARDLLLNAALGGTGSGRSLDLLAGRDIAQAQGASAQTANGAIALQAGGNITLETLHAGSAGIALIAGGAVIDGDAAGDAETDLTAASLRLTAAGAAGSGSNALETAVATLSASAASLALVQSGTLAVGRVATTLQRVQADASTTALDLGAQEDLLTSGALLLTVSSGDLTLGGGSATPATAVNAGGPLLLRAVAGSLAVNAGLSGAAATSLRAGGDLSFAAAGDVTLAGAASFDAEAGGALNMADGAVLASGSGALRLSATANLSLGQLQTGGDVSLLARSVADAGGAEIDISARALRLVTTGSASTQGFGTGAAPVQMQLATLAAQVAGTGGFFAREADTLAVAGVSVSVARVAGDGSLGTVADTLLSDLVSSGNLVLATGGALSLGDGPNADGIAVLAGANLLLDVAGALTVDGALRSSGGAISLLASGNIVQNAEIAAQRAGRTLDIQAGGSFGMAASTQLSTLDANLRVQAGAGIGLASVSAGTGSVSLLAAGGSVFATLGHTGVEVSAAALRVNAADGVGSSASPLDTAVQRISGRAGAGGIWVLDADAITVAEVAVSVRRVSLSATTAASVDDAAQADLVTTAGSGAISLATRSGAVTLPSGGLQLQGPVTLDSGLRLDGAVAITAGLGGARGDGSIRIGGAIDGIPGGAADVLSLASDGADVVFGGAVGAVERPAGLSLADARNVTFEQDVKLAGPLTLQASGWVEFKAGLDLSSGALSIVGASQLVIGHVVISSGDAVIRVDALTLSGLISGSAGASLQLAGAGPGSDVTAGGASIGGLLLTGSQLEALRGFGSVQIGRTDQGATVVDAALLNSIASPRLALAGSSINLTGAALGAGLQVLDLSAARDIALSGALSLVGASADVRATAGGALRMAAGATLLTQSGDVQLQAGGDLVVGRIDTRGSGASPAPVVLVSSSGSITEVQADAAADVYASLFTLRGRGALLAPGMASNAAALDVQATRLDVDAMSGVVLRDSGADGRTVLNLLEGGQLYQQLLALGASDRQASTAGPAGSSPAAADAWAWLSAVRPLNELRHVAAFSGLSPWPGGAAMPAERPQALHLEASADELPTARHLAAGRFQLWSEALSL